jgi:arginyl-tRNA synthetase
VIRANYQGDVGLHVAKCVWAMSKFRPEKYPTDINERVDFLSRCYVEGAKMYEKGGAAKDEIIELNSKIYHQNDKRINKIWELGVKWSLDKFRQLYKRLDTVFDRQYLESETVKLGFYYVNLALKKGILSKSRGAVIFNGEKYGLDTRVFLNNQGFLTYEGKELGLVYLKLKEFGKLDLHVNNVAIEQKSFFRVVYKVEELLDPEHFKGVNYHNAYDFVGLKSGKMSSRKGQVVSAESVLNEANKRIKKIIEQAETKLTEEEIDKIAIAAVKYTFQKMSPFKYLAFDLDACVSFSGDSGPYLQYTYARAISILRKNIAVNEEENYQINQSERLLLQKLWQYKEIIKNAVLNYSPNYLAGYLNDLAQVFNNYYVHYKVRGNRFRTELTQATAQVIKNGLYLLGIKTLDRM